MRVREDDIERADGSRGIYGVVEKPNFVVVVALDGVDVWLVEQYRYAIGLRRWELPQGSHEHDRHAEPADVARAELLEETGVAADRVESLGRFHTAPGYSTQMAEVFVATGLSEGAARRTPEEADLVAAKLPVATVHDMMRAGDITDATSIAAWMTVLLRRPALLRGV